MMFLPEIIEETDPDKVKNNRKLSTGSTKSAKFNSNREYFNDSSGVMQ